MFAMPTGTVTGTINKLLAKTGRMPSVTFVERGVTTKKIISAVRDMGALAEMKSQRF